MDPSVEQQTPPPEGRKLTPELKELLKPGKTAVIVVDVQGAYCDPNEVLPTLLHSDTDELQEMAERLSEFVDKAREAGVTIVWTKMAEHPDHVSPNLSFKMRVDDTPPISTPDTPGFDYYKVTPREGDIEIVKSHYNSFDGTNLDDQLKERDIQTVVLVGGYASRCITATGFGAADTRDYNLFVPNDLVAVPRRFESEKAAALSVIDTTIGYVVPSADIASVWSENLPQAQTAAT